MTFAELHDHLSARGVEVGIARTPCGFALTLHDATRALRLAVPADDFDRAARMLSLSAEFQHCTGGRLDWPELAGSCGPERAAR